MANDYISRDSVMMDILCAGKIGKLTCIDIIKKASAADVVEVVRCKECKYAPLSGTSGFDMEWPEEEWPHTNPCPFLCDDSFYSRRPEDDFFCGYGTKKDDADEQCSSLQEGGGVDR